MTSQAEEDNHRELTNTPVTINCPMLLAKVKENEQIGNKHPISSYLQALQYEDIVTKSHLTVASWSAFRSEHFLPRH